MRPRVSPISSSHKSSCITYSLESTGSAQVDKADAKVARLVTGSCMTYADRNRLLETLCERKNLNKAEKCEQTRTLQTPKKLTSLTTTRMTRTVFRTCDLPTPSGWWVRQMADYAKVDFGRGYLCSLSVSGDTQYTHRPASGGSSDASRMHVENSSRESPSARLAQPFVVTRGPAPLCRVWTQILLQPKVERSYLPECRTSEGSDATI
jgi:hypothetical protein